MKVTSYALARPDYIDRRATTKTSIYSAGGIAPHGLTVRVTYTCPAGKKAYIENIFTQTFRETAATTTGATILLTRLTTADANAGTVLRTHEFQTATYVTINDHSNSVALMIAGDVLEGATQDTSTGGGVAITISLKYTEFDA